MDIGPSNRKPCRSQLDIGPGTTESRVELNSTMDLVQRKALSNSTRHWTVTVLLTLFTQSFSHETYFTGLKWFSVVNKEELLR
jgi:hypothetical protein